MRARLAPFILYSVVAVVHLVTLLTPSQEFSTQTKWFLMPTLLLAFLIALRPKRGDVIAFVGVALGFSLVGDILIGMPGMGFLLGLGAFLIVHVAYLVLFLRPLRVRRMPWIAVGYLVWWAVLVAVLAPHVGSLLIPVAVYGLVLAASSAAALGTNRFIALGAFLFMLSDTLLAFKMFLGWHFYPIDFIIMIPYIVGQGLIVYGTVNRGGTNQSRPASTT